MFKSGVTFGWSIWIIPDNYEWFREKYRIEHIPHITIQSRIINPLSSHIGKTYKFQFERGFHLLPVWNPKDKGFRSWAWYCKVNGLDIPHAHMSIQYFDELDKGYDRRGRNIYPPKGEFTGTAHLVDTRSHIPSEWKIVKNLNEHL